MFPLSDHFDYGFSFISTLSTYLWIDALYYYEGFAWSVNGEEWPIFGPYSLDFIEGTVTAYVNEDTDCFLGVAGQY